MPYIHNLFSGNVLTLQTSGTDKNIEMYVSNTLNDFIENYGFKKGEYCILEDHWNTSPLRWNVILHERPRVSRREMKQICKQLESHIDEFVEKHKLTGLLKKFSFKVMWGEVDIPVGNKNHDEDY